MYHILLFIMFGFSAVQSVRVFKEALFHDVEVLERYNITSSILDVTSRYESMTRMDCAKQCLTLDFCLSFFHNSITNQCQFHTEVFLENTGATTQAGTVYFYQDGKEAPFETKPTTATTTVTTPTTTRTTTTISAPTTTVTTPTTTISTTTTITTTPFHCPTEDGFQMLGSDEMCVKFHTDKKTWSDANDECASYSPKGHLVVVDTAVKDTLVRKAGISIDSQFSGRVFNGLNVEGWVDGSPVVYTSWVPGESFTPGSKECTTYSRGSGWTWKATDCADLKHYVCQIPF